jgi:hypothetical protein
VGFKKSVEATILIDAAQPSGDTVGVVLITRPFLTIEAATPQRWINLDDGGAAMRDVPSVERPEMHSRTKPLANETQPGNASVGRFSHCPLHIEVKNGFRATRALLRQTAPAGTAHSLSAIADKTVADEIDVDAPVGRPMPLEIVKKVGPIRFQAV